MNMITKYFLCRVISLFDKNMIQKMWSDEAGSGVGGKG